MLSKTPDIPIGIDLMGGDSAPASLFQGIIKALEQVHTVSVVAFLTPAVYKFISTSSLFLTLPEQIKQRLIFELVADFIPMDALPLVSLRKQKGASVSVGMRFLKQGKIQAFLSTGNTGALLAAATLTMTLLPGIRRPALLALLPSEKGPVVAIDVGGSIAAKSVHLVQFALMGAAFQRCTHFLEKPRVGLLNVGVESKKGTSELQKTYQLLQEAEFSSLTFIGNVEGRDVFNGDVDVLITDGFTGNIFLKTTEGVSLFLMNQFQQLLVSHHPQLQKDVFDLLRNRFHYEKQHGALLCGVDGIVMKCHGSTSTEGMTQAILGCVKMVEMDLIGRLKIALQSQIA